MNQEIYNEIKKRLKEKDEKISSLFYTDLYFNSITNILRYTDNSSRVVVDLLVSLAVNRQELEELFLKSKLVGKENI
jgi:hypothetical protein